MADAGVATEPIPARNRLPTLYEVLTRRTLAPIDLFSFYIYMRDQQRAVDYLDFWLDVSQHMSICRIYIRNIRSSVLVSDADAISPTIAPANTPISGLTEEEPSTSGITRADIRASAEKILYTYLLPGTERELVLPSTMLNEIQDNIEGPEQRSDPEVFDHAKDYVFQAMERDAFPGFLRALALGNLTPVHLAIRLIIGIFSLFGAFWVAFTLVFLNRSRLGRCWVLIPFSVAIYCLVSHQYTLDPLLAFFGYSEYTFLSFTRAREPYVRRLLLTRSIMVWIFTLFFIAVLCVTFILVPGPRRKVLA